MKIFHFINKAWWDPQWVVSNFMYTSTSTITYSQVHNQRVIWASCIGQKTIMRKRRLMCNEIADHILLLLQLSFTHSAFRPFGFNFTNDLIRAKSSSWYTIGDHHRRLQMASCAYLLQQRGSQEKRTSTSNSERWE